MYYLQSYCANYCKIEMMETKKQTGNTVMYYAYVGGCKKEQNN